MDHDKHKQTKEDFHRRMALYRKQRDSWCSNCDLGKDQTFDCYGCSVINNIYYTYFPEAKNDT